MNSHTDRVIVLVDMDCFYCQVEEKLDPKLKGKPIAVVQYNAWKGGGIIAVNYPARDRGVTRHMRGDEAKRKCPEIELVKVPNVRGKADLTKYREAGKKVADVLIANTPIVQRASVDEAYLDITEIINKRISSMTARLTIDSLQNTHVVGCETKDYLYNIYNNDLYDEETNLKLAVGGAIVEEIRADVFEKTGYRCSAGIAHNKILAKLACGLHKPNQQTILPQNGVQGLFEKLPIKKIKSLGGKFGNVLAEGLNITYMGELLKFSEKELLKKYDEKTALWLYNIARGIDKEPVTVQLISKSIGCCKKFPGKTALKSAENVKHWLSELATEISERLEQDIEENNRRANQIILSYAQQIDRKDIHSSKSYTPSSYDAKKIASDAFEILKKNTQKPDGSFCLKFLGISAGKFENCKNVNNITSFFKTTNKISNETVESSNTDVKMKLKNDNKKTNTISSFLNTSKMKVNDEIVKKQFFKSEDKENISKIENFNEIENNELIDLNNIEMDATINDDLDLNKTIQEIQNIRNMSDDEYSNTTVVLDYGEILKEKEEFPFSEDKSYSYSDSKSAENKTDLGDTSKSFFKKYVRNFENPVGLFLNQEIPSCSYQVNTSEEPIILNAENDARNDETVPKNLMKICPECNEKILEVNFLTHMDHHMALKLMEEERTQFKNQMKIEKTMKSPIKNTKLQKTKSVKRKLNVLDKNASIVTFLSKESEENTENKVQCSECSKKILKENFPCHQDYHEAKRLHLELNPVKTGDSVSSLLTKNKKKIGCKSANGVVSIANFFKNAQ